MEKHIQELIRAAKAVVKSEIPSTADDNVTIVSFDAVARLSDAIDSLEVAEARAARKAVQK